MFTWIERNLGSLLGLLTAVCLLAFILSGCDANNKHDSEVRKNFKATISAMNLNEHALTNDKHHAPTTCNVVLFKVLNENNYFTINSCDYFMSIKLNDAWMYNHRVGDTAYFEFLRNERFFSIKDRK